MELQKRNKEAATPRLKISIGLELSIPKKIYPPSVRLGWNRRLHLLLAPSDLLTIIGRNNVK